MTHAKTQRRKEGEQSQSLFSCLRAFVPSCEFYSHPAVSWRGVKEIRFTQSRKVAKRSETKRNDYLMTSKKWYGFLFAHEGTKARRHEGKTEEEEKGRKSRFSWRFHAANPFAPLRLCVSPFLRLSVLFLAVAAAALHAEDTSRYTDEMFRKAIENHSTAPNYVLVTIRDLRKGTEQLVCTEAPFLLGALHTENGIGYDEYGSAKVQKIALSNFKRIYAFSNPKALENVKPRYAPEILQQVRMLLSGKSDAELYQKEILESLYVKREADYAAYRDAIAHVLLEHGILCGRGCISGNIYLDTISSKKP